MGGAEEVESGSGWPFSNAIVTSNGVWLLTANRGDSVICGDVRHIVLYTCKLITTRHLELLTHFTAPGLVVLIVHGLHIVPAVTTGPTLTRKLHTIQSNIYQGHIKQCCYGSKGKSYFISV